MLPSVDTWLTLGSGHYLTDLLGDPGLEGEQCRSTSSPTLGTSISSCNTLGPTGRGRGRAGQWTGGVWFPHCPGGISWSNCPEAPGPGP